MQAQARPTIEPTQDRMELIEIASLSPLYVGAVVQTDSWRTESLSAVGFSLPPQLILAYRGLWFETSQHRPHSRASWMRCFVKVEVSLMVIAYFRNYENLFVGVATPIFNLNFGNTRWLLLGS